MSRVFHFRKPFLEKHTALLICDHLDRIKRNRDQVRHRNSSGFMYCFAVKKTGDAELMGHIAGPDSESPLSVKIKVSENKFGKIQVQIVSRDRKTTYESAMELAKHALKKMLKSLESKPHKFNEGLSKTHWDGFFLSYSGKRNSVNDYFGEIFEEAIAAKYFPRNFKETCKEFGFNIEAQTAGVD